MRAKVYVTLKNGVLDPAGEATKQALTNLGFKNVKNVRIGKFIEVEIEEKNKIKAEKTLDDMAQKLLANTVIENFKIEV